MSVTNSVGVTRVAGCYGNGIGTAPPTPEGDGAMGTADDGQTIGSETAAFEAVAVVGGVSVLCL